MLMCSDSALSSLPPSYQSQWNIKHNYRQISKAKMRFRLHTWSRKAQGWLRICPTATTNLVRDHWAMCRLDLPPGQEIHWATNEDPSTTTCAHDHLCILTALDLPLQKLCLQVGVGICRRFKHRQVRTKRLVHLLLQQKTRTFRPPCQISTQKAQRWLFQQKKIPTTLQISRLQRSQALTPMALWYLQQHQIT